MTPAELTQSLKCESERLGFQLANVCAAVSPVGFSNFERWLDAGYAGEMSYLESRKSAYEHPSSVLDGVKCIVMLGMGYRTQDPVKPTVGTGRIARYAWGESDYHDLIHSRLKQLKRHVLKMVPHANVRGVVDTAPLLEREFAELAGLGWRAKNTLLINKHFGSWLLLAALLVDIELVLDQPMETIHCGTCTACLDACPTDAFVDPFVLDATQCISYLTIEHRSAIPMVLREKMQDWILGCDVCQDVCPWNRKAPLSQEKAFQPKPNQNPVELRTLFRLDDEVFRARFRKTPLWRPKRRGILRNAAIALGNRPDPGNIPALQLGANDPEPLVRGASVWALGRHADPSALEILSERQRVETDSDVLQELTDARLAWSNQ